MTLQPGKQTIAIHILCIPQDEKEIKQLIFFSDNRL